MSAAIAAVLKSLDSVLNWRDCSLDREKTSAGVLTAGDGRPDLLRNYRNVRRDVWEREAACGTLLATVGLPRRRVCYRADNPLARLSERRAGAVIKLRPAQPFAE